MDVKMRMRAEEIRKELHNLVDREINNFLAAMESGAPVERTNIVMPLSMTLSYFKGKKPVAVVYADGREVETATWKKVAEELLRNCADDEVMYSRLCQIRGLVNGRDRTLFAGSGEGMDCPIEFSPGMFFESKFDTETLLRVIIKRIFEPIRYDYGHISLKITDPITQALLQKNSDTQQQAAEQTDAPDMEMTM